MRSSSGSTARAPRPEPHTRRPFRRSATPFQRPRRGPLSTPAHLLTNLHPRPPASLLFPAQAEQRRGPREVSLTRRRSERAIVLLEHRRRGKSDCMATHRAPLPPALRRQGGSNRGVRGAVARWDVLGRRGCVTGRGGPARRGRKRGGGETAKGATRRDAPRVLHVLLLRRPMRQERRAGGRTRASLARRPLRTMRGEGCVVRVLLGPRVSRSAPAALAPTDDERRTTAAGVPR